MPKLPRRLTILSAGLVTGLLLLPAAGQAATTFGSRLNHDPANSGECNQFEATCTLVSYIEPSDPEGSPYSGGAPVSGVITKFKIRATVTTEPQQVTFRVADITRQDESTALATVAATGPTVTLQVNEEALEAPIQEFNARVPVKQGQHLAIDAGRYVQATINDSGQKFTYVYSPPLVDGGGARGSLEPTGELLVAATIEPDADGDGYGDETQDQCPSQKSTQGPCDNTPPRVGGLKVRNGRATYSLSEAATVSLRLEKKLRGRKVGRKCVKQTAANRHHRRCARFKTIRAKFGGPGKKGLNRVTLPNGKRLKPGTYRLTLTAIDVAGNKTVKRTVFKVKKKRKTKH